jgi:hypothetical protein
MKIEMGSGGRVGKGRGFVEEQDQVGALPEVRRRGASEGEAPGLRKEFLGEDRAMKGRGSRHETAPGVIGQTVFSDDPPNILTDSGAREPYR